MKGSFKIGLAASVLTLTTGVVVSTASAAVSALLDPVPDDVLVQRRRNARPEARRALEAARNCVESIGAVPFAELVGAELGKGRRAGGGEALTRAEQQVADLVAAGLTNREVAARLFISVRTVETHLVAVYRKLEIRSRSELAARRGTAPRRLIP